LVEFSAALVLVTESFFIRSFAGLATTGFPGNDGRTPLATPAVVLVGLLLLLLLPMDPLLLGRANGRPAMGFREGGGGGCSFAPERLCLPNGIASTSSSNGSGGESVSNDLDC